MTYGLVLLQHRFVALRIFGFDGGVATLVEEELGLIQIFFLACGQIKLGKSHLGNLMAWNHTCLTWLVAHFLHHAVSELARDVEQAAFACGVVMGYGSLT